MGTLGNALESLGKFNGNHWKIKWEPFANSAETLGQFNGTPLKIQWGPLKEKRDSRRKKNK